MRKLPKKIIKRRLEKIVNMLCLGIPPYLIAWEVGLSDSAISQIIVKLKKENIIRVIGTRRRRKFVKI